MSTREGNVLTHNRAAAVRSDTVIALQRWQIGQLNKELDYLRSFVRVLAEAQPEVFRPAS
jgi:hypothetical protein